MQLTLPGVPEGKKKVRPISWRESVPQLLEENDWKCFVCGGEIHGTGAAHVWVEHIIPRAQGGEDIYGNLAVSHPTCNLLRSDRDMDDPALPALIAKARALVQKPLKERTCINEGCNANIADRGPQAVNCLSCVERKEREYGVRYRRINRKRLSAVERIRRRKKEGLPAIRTCLDCGANIHHRGSPSVRCEPCQLEYSRRRARENQRALRAAQKAAA